MELSATRPLRKDIFFETINAAGVLQVPMAVSVWDDGWGISVPNKYQTTKGNISEILKGFEKKTKIPTVIIFTKLTPGITQS